MKIRPRAIPAGGLKVNETMSLEDNPGNPYSEIIPLQFSCLQRAGRVLPLRPDIPTSIRENNKKRGELEGTAGPGKGEVGHQVNKSK